MPQKHLVQPQPVDRMNLNTLPDFMKAPSPQVKFHSAFPPLTTKVRVRSVMERAGFDVYKPEKDKNRSASSSYKKSPTLNDLATSKLDNGSFMPPNRILNNKKTKSLQSRSFSHTQNHSAPKLSGLTGNNTDEDYVDANDSFNFANPANKGRNFTTAPNYVNSTSTPNLIITHSPTHSNAEQKMVNYVKQNLDLTPSTGQHFATETLPPPTEFEREKEGQVQDHVQNQNQNQNQNLPQPTLPDINLPPTRKSTLDADIPSLINDDTENSVIMNKGINSQFQPDYMQELENETNEYNPYDYEPDPFKESTQLPSRVIPRLSGPRPFQNSDEDLLGNDDDQFEDAQQNLREMELATQSQRLSTMSAVSAVASTNSVGSFDDKFMIAVEDTEQPLQVPIVDTIDVNSSHESLGGLSGMRDLMKSTEPGEYREVTPDIEDPYKETPKRLSTMGISDPKIYNLQSLDGETEYNEMSMIQEREIEDSMLRHSTEFDQEMARVPNLVLNEEDGSPVDLDQESFSDADSGSQIDSEVEHTQGLNLAETSNLVPSIHVESDHTDVSATEYPSENVLPSRDALDAQIPVDGVYDEDVDLQMNSTEEKLLQKGFQKRRASTHSTPAVEHPEHAVSASVPIIPSISGHDGIPSLINGIESFQINDTMGSIDTDDDIRIPPRHFEKDHHESISNTSGSISGSEGEFSPPAIKNHPYSALSGETYTKTNSIDSNAYGRNNSSAVTTPEHEVFQDALSRKSIYDAIDSPYHHREYSQHNSEFADEQDDDHSVLPSTELEPQTTIEPEVQVEVKKEHIYPPGEGPCRHCGKDIHESEKKIWSKDHQLSGQWHRKCFGCHDCGQKFSKGSSCYVFNDQPYCETHFHEMNGSLCQVCNKGVEGECLQNDVNEAFHIDCLKCVICGLNVEGDYFVFRDEVMCEEDANELMHQIEEAEKDYRNQDVDKMIKRRTRVLYL